MGIAELKSGPTPAMRAHDLEHVAGFFERLGLGRLAYRMPPRALWAAYVSINGFLSIGLLALLAVITGVPFIFPSVGPTAYELFFRPRSEASTPHNTLIGHLIGLGCGYGAFRLLHAPPGTLENANFDWRMLIAAALAIGATAALMILLDASHPPAGATTLIVALGLITKPAYLAILEVAVLLLTFQAFCINRLAGLPYPIWKSGRD